MDLSGAGAGIIRRNIDVSLGFRFELYLGMR